MRARTHTQMQEAKKQLKTAEHFSRLGVVVHTAKHGRAALAPRMVGGAAKKTSKEGQAEDGGSQVFEQGDVLQFVSATLPWPRGGEGW